MTKQTITIVVPSYNEMANLAHGSLDAIRCFFRDRDDSWDVIVVDDGSDDGSRQFLRGYARAQPRFRLIENPHLGKAGAVTAGMLAATGDAILFTDMDQATPIAEIEKLLPYLEQGYEVVIGSRANARQGAPLSRLMLARGMTLARSALIGLPGVRDSQCGFKLFSNKAAHDLFARLQTIHRGFRPIKGSSVTAAFDVEILYLAGKAGYKVKEIPVDWRYVETNRVNPTRDALRGAIDLLSMRRSIAKGRYDDHRS